MSAKHFRLLAQYNQWMNRKVYDAAMKLEQKSLWEDRGAFFKSVMGTLNHIMVADLIWLNRYRHHPSAFPELNHLDSLPKPKALDQMMFADLAELGAARGRIDQIIQDWASNLTDDDLLQPLAYQSTQGQPSSREFGLLLLHFFNHQTHHRGQVTTLLSQFGVDVGATDLAILIPEQTSEES